MPSDVDKYYGSHGQLAASTVATERTPHSTPDDNTQGWAILTIVLVLYFLPALTASQRRHRNRHAIGIMNLFLGWTLLGWIGALIWAFTANTEPRP
ncbi:MAG TPA: superinfection immunity protein [Terriglobales bacterium]|nr:superinfection immunity protein [Terriglobales bacterium]